MKHLKEMKEKKNQKEISKENQQQPPRMREDFVDKIVDNSAAYARGITRKALAEAAAKIGATVDEVNAWQAYMDESLWTFKDGSKVNWRNFRRSLRMWHMIEEKMRKERLEHAAVNHCVKGGVQCNGCGLYFCDYNLNDEGYCEDCAAKFGFDEESEAAKFPSADRP